MVTTRNAAKTTTTTTTTTTTRTTRATTTRAMMDKEKKKKTDNTFSSNDSAIGNRDDDALSSFFRLHTIIHQGRPGGNGLISFTACHPALFGCKTQSEAYEQVLHWLREDPNLSQMYTEGVDYFPYNPVDGNFQWMLMKTKVFVGLCQYRAPRGIEFLNFSHNHRMVASSLKSQ